MARMLMPVESGDDGRLDCDFVVVDIDRKELSKLLKRFASVKKRLPSPMSDNLEELVFFDTLVVLSTTKVAKLLDMDIDDIEDIEEVTKIDVPGERLDSLNWERTEIERLVLAEDHIRWTFTPKHTEITLSTKPLHLSDFDTCAELVKLAEE